MPKIEIENQKKAIAEFETAIQALDLPATFHPHGNTPLALLKAALAAESDEQGRAKKKEQAQEALNKAKQHLALLEQKWDALSQRAKDGAGKLKRTADRVNQLSEQFNNALREFQNLDSE